MQLFSLNHVSFVFQSVMASSKFYEELLGFNHIRRPSSFNFDGGWLINNRFGIHLIQSDSKDDLPREPKIINPKDNRISFQCSDIGSVISKLEAMGIRYVKGMFEEGGIKVDQIFFHDSDGYMIEICNCDMFPVLPLSSSCSFKQPTIQGKPMFSKTCEMVAKAYESNASKPFKIL
ncbi:hypothetical protein AMTRI_Chr09g40340 [Amborella trichopoda]